MKTRVVATAKKVVNNVQAHMRRGVSRGSRRKGIVQQCDDVAVPERGLRACSEVTGS